MKSTVFARPNLKVFLLGAILLVVIQHIITYAHSQALFKPLPANARELSDEDLRQMVRQATETPTVDAYLRLSHCYEARGDYRRALQYLRRAERISQAEDEPD
jgi:tetratricopeptide (TPR) repeat protein